MKTPLERYTKQFEKLKQQKLAPHSWFITHVPTWGVRSGPKFLDPTLQQVLKNGDPDLMNVELFLGGHIHLWEAIGFEKGPPQFVLGNGGANLAPSINSAIRK